MFAAKSRRVHQDWQSAEKSNANPSLDTVSRFFRVLTSDDVPFGFVVEDGC